MKIVQKYGGSSLADAECVRRVAIRIQRDAKNNQMLVVVSAQGKTTDALTKRYKELSGQYPTRESDALLTTGEQASAALLAATLCHLGTDAVSLNGIQVPILVSGVHGDGRIKQIDTLRIQREWNRGRIVVVTGFQGVNDCGDLITLGRGGSDTSAVALAAALKADRCMIFTDVDGVYSSDPRKIQQAVRFHEIHQDTMLNLTLHGAKVLHPRAAALAKQYQVPTEILTSFSHRTGTVISADSPHQTGITLGKDEGNTCTVTIVFKKLPENGLLANIVKTLGEHPVSIRYGSEILQAIVPSSLSEELLCKLHAILY